MKNMNNRGQALIEAAISLPLILATMAGFALVLYHGLIYYVADYNLHESLVCLQFESKRTCQNEAENKIKSVLPHQDKVQVQISKGYKSYSGSVAVTGLVRLEISKKISL